MRIHHRILLVFLFGLISIGFTTLSFANDNVVNQVGLFTSEEIVNLTSQLNKKKTEMNTDIVVVTTNDTEGKDSETYADDFFDENGYGVGNSKDGVLFLIDMKNRQYYISTSGSMIRYLTESRIDEMGATVAPFLSSEEYMNAATTFLNSTYNYYEQGIPSNQYNKDTETGKISTYKHISLIEGSIAVTCGLATSIAFFVITINRYNLSNSSYTYPYNQKGFLYLTVNKNTLINSFVTTRRIPPPPKNNDGGGGGGSF